MEKVPLISISIARPYYPELHFIFTAAGVLSHTTALTWVALGFFFFLNTSKKNKSGESLSWTEMSAEPISEGGIGHMEYL